ncbi:MAG: class I SAM-dependent methyltransferase, partial [Solirubrobacteraceae bacterium]
HQVIVDPTYGYRRLEPMPSDSEFERFYESEYYDLLRQGGRAPELRRLLSGGDEADRERAWLRDQMYADITAELTAAGSGRSVLDVGCGQGELLQWLGEQGFEPHGIEPSDDAAALARERGLDARTATLEELLSGSDPAPTYSAVLLLNVLEHVPDAPAMLRGISRLLEPAGLLYIRVPNDFNPLQLAAQDKLGTDPWWIAVPDHVNYFSVESLVALNRRLGFEPVDVQADFPMELFLLWGDNYVGDPAVGAACHAKRVEAERSIPAEVRRDMFRSFAANGIGRNSRLLVRKVAEPDDVGG